MELTKRLRFVNLPQFATLHDSTMADPDALIGQTVSHYRIIGVGVCLQADGALRRKISR